MMTLVLLALGLIVATWFLWFILERGFMSGISWFDDRNAEREREAEKQRARIKERARATKLARYGRASAPVKREDDEEWAEYIDV